MVGVHVLEASDWCLMYSQVCIWLQLLSQCLKVVPATNGRSDHECALLSNRPVQRVKCKTSERTAVMASYSSMMYQS